MNFLGLRNIEAAFFIPAWFVLPSITGVCKHFLRRATLKILLLPRVACSYYICYTCNRFETLKKVLHELPQNDVTVVTTG